MAAGWLTELKSDPERALWGMRLQLDGDRGQRELAQYCMSLSEDHRMAEPDDPSAGAFCDYCGNSNPGELDPDEDLGPGSSVPCACHGALTRPCRDTAACAERRSQKYPPDMARVPAGLLVTAGPEAAAAARLVRLAVGQALTDYLELAAREDEHELELAGQQDDYALRGIPAGAAGAWDVQGGWHPVNFNWANWHWRHTISGGAHHGHLISGGARLGASAASATVQAARQQARQVPEGVPPGVQQAISGEHAGADISMAPASAAAPQRPVPRPRRPQYGRRPGRKAAFPRRVLKYQGRR
jgi:hypothetical protein